MKSTALPRWLYGNPLDIIDGQRALTLRGARKPTVEPVRESKDKYYTMSKAVGIKALVKNAKRNGGSR